MPTSSNKNSPNSPIEKTNLHPRNAHRNGYDFAALCVTSPSLKAFVAPNKYGNESIDFADPKAVRALNSALLKHFYKVDYWGIPEGYLCPPIPGRADYIHAMADILTESNKGTLPSNIIGLDIGTGSNIVYPLLGYAIYDWKFVGTETDEVALENGTHLIEENPGLADKISLRRQFKSTSYFKGIITPDEHFDFTMCNPPFHSSPEEARDASIRKTSNLNKRQVEEPVLNFGGSNHELWCEGGETHFIKKMMEESIEYGRSCFWFSTLVSKGSSLDDLGRRIKSLPIQDTRLIDMSQGQKQSRFIAWTFLTRPEQTQWRQKFWQKLG
jgi:23S rRNA (adenine1618-N6)-methyltransferase